MSLYIGVKKGEATDYTLSFENDGYYWYLHPLFEKMAESIGIYIDLYGDAEFNKDNIVHLESLLAEANNMISKEADYWNVHTGTQTKPEHKEIYSKVSKTNFINKLNLLGRLVTEVKENNLKLVFFGD